MEFIPLIMERYLQAVWLSVSVKIDGCAINELISVLVSFIISICLLIEKAIDLDKVTLSMLYIQL